MREEVNRVDPINILRFFAAMCVFLLHTTLFENTSYFSQDSWTFLFRTPAWGGVWMLMTLGGYLAGRSFYLAHYKSTVKDSLRYYWQRLTKTVIPTLAFILICAVFVFPEFFPNNPDVLIQIFTLSYIGRPGVDGIGATWYVFMIAWFYIYTPPAAWLLNRIRLQKHSRIIYVVIFMSLATAVCAIRIYSHLCGLVWYSFIYTNAFTNVDLFFCGFVLSYLHLDILKGNTRTVQFINKNTSIFKIIAVALLVGTIVVNCYVYNMANFIYDPYFFIYAYIFPTIYLIVVSIYLILVDRNVVKYEKVTLRSIKGNPFRLIDAFSLVSLEFYLFHSLILNRVSPYVHVGGPLETHLALLFVTGILTLICSICFHRIFMRKQTLVNR